MFTGLHACGGLSDLILAHAVSSGAGFCVCTCCFMSNRQIALPLVAQSAAARGRDGVGLARQLPREGAADRLDGARLDGAGAGDRQAGRQTALGGGAADRLLGEQTLSRDAWLGVPPTEVEALLRLAELQAR